jgi:hypothetical protein
MEDIYFWEQQCALAVNDFEFREAMDRLMLAMCNADLMSMSWDDEKEDFVFFMTDAQRKVQDRKGH